MTALTVSLPGRRVGELVQERGGLVRWLPDPAWEADGQHPRLGANFLARPGPRRAGTGLPVWFENLLPDRQSRLRQRLAGLHGLREGQSFALLGVLGRDLTGAVEVRGLGDAEDDPPPSSVEPALWLDGAVRWSSLTGAQMKFSMSMVGEGLTLGAQGSGSHWIVKFPGVRFEDLPAVEQATMSWARQAGFEVPDHFTPEVARLLGIPLDWVDGAERAFAVRRFDRRDDGTKIHQEDLCQALDLAPDDKYGNRAPRVTFDGALRLVMDVAGEAGGREAARRMGFVIASGNSDAHLKNWSLLWGDAARPALTPCYDLVSTIAWPDFGWGLPQGPSLALKMGGEELFGRIDHATLAAFAELSGLSWARDEVIAGVLRAKESWREIEPSAPDRMRRALATHWEAVPLLRDIGR